MSSPLPKRISSMYVTSEDNNYSKLIMTATGGDPVCRPLTLFQAFYELWLIYKYMDNLVNSYNRYHSTTSAYQRKTNYQDYKALTFAEVFALYKLIPQPYDYTNEDICELEQTDFTYAMKFFQQLTEQQITRNVIVENTRNNVRIQRAAHEKNRYTRAGHKERKLSHKLDEIKKNKANEELATKLEYELKRELRAERIFTRSQARSAIAVNVADLPRAAVLRRMCKRSQPHSRRSRHISNNLLKKDKKI